MHVGSDQRVRIELHDYFPFWGLKNSGPLHTHFETYKTANEAEFKAVEAEVETASAVMWRASFKAMCSGAYPTWVEFCKDQLSVARGHVAVDGALANPDAETRERLDQTKPTNKLAESAFGIFDRLLRSIPNASTVTLSAMTAAKFTHPFDWIRDNTTTLQQHHMFNWVRSAAKPRAMYELKKSADQRKQAQQDEDAQYQKATQKELENAKEWEMLRQLKANEMVKSSEDLSQGMKKAQAEPGGMTVSQQTKSAMAFLKRQRQFLFLDGLPADKAPFLKCTTTSGCKVDYTPQEFCKLLGVVVDKVKRGEFESIMKPVVPLTDKLVELCMPFRNGTHTEFMTRFIAEEKSKLTDMVAQVKVHVDAGLTRLTQARKIRALKKKVTPEKLTVGMTVWVHDDDDQDLEASKRVWEGTVVRKTKGVKGSWDIEFGNRGTTYYPRDYIFLTEADAATDMLM